MTPPFLSTWGRVAALAALALCPIASPRTIAAGAPAVATPKPETKSSVFLSAAEANFHYEGRFDDSDPTAPGVVWQASRVSLDFDGDTLGLRFGNVTGQVFFNAELDGRASVIELRAGSDPVGTTFSSLGAGRHRLRLFKRSEASAGTVRFLGADLAAGAKSFPPKPTDYRVKMEFFGDSITAGACNEDGATDQWDNRRTHNAAASYAAWVAAAFQADLRDIAVSGMGVATGWTDVKAGEMWNRTFPAAGSRLADLTRWQPDVLFINLGENDDSYTRAKEQSFPAEAFAQGYISLVRSFRAAYPAAQIVLLRGGMYGGAQSERLRTPWEQAVVELERSDPHVAHYVFAHWSRLHPRVSDHHAMADELISWLRQQNFKSLPP